jgi:ferric-dicitrate binding protein FerR (iron transport regulator)
MPSDEVRTEAARWFSEMTLGDDRATRLPELNAWLAQDLSHRRAFADVLRTSRLLKPLFRAAALGAGAAEVNAFFDALAEEKARSAKDFAH